MSKPTVTLTIAGDEKGLVASTEKAGSALDRMADRVQRSGASMLSLASNLGTAGSAISGVTSAVGALATASGALLALPAVGVAAAGVMAAVKLGAEGATRAFERLGPTIDGLKGAVSASFERSLNPAVNNLKGILPQLQKPLQNIVAQIGGMATEATRVAKMPENMRVLKGALDGAGLSTGNLRNAVAPLTQAFIDLVSVGVPGLASMTQNAGGLAQSFADWVREAKESGQLKQWLDNGIAALKAMWAALKDIAGIVGGVFRGLSAGAGGAVAPFGMLLDAINRIVNSAEGQEVLRAIGEALRTIGDAITSVAMPAFEALAPLIPPLLELFSSVVSILAENLVPVIEFLAPIIQDIATYIAENVNWLGPLAAGLGIAAAAFWVLNAAMSANPIGIVVVALAALAVGIAELIKWLSTLGPFFSSIWNGIKDVVSSVAGWIRDRWNDLVGFFSSIPRKIGDAFSSVGDFIGRAFKSALNVAIDVINWFVDRANDIIYGINVVSPFEDIPYIGHIARLHTGGKVGGAPGTEQLRVLQAGETVLPANSSSGSSGRATVTFAGGTDSAVASMIMGLINSGQIQIST